MSYICKNAMSYVVILIFFKFNLLKFIKNKKKKEKFNIINSKSIISVFKKQPLFQIQLCKYTFLKLLLATISIIFNSFY